MSETENATPIEAAPAVAEAPKKAKSETRLIRKTVYAWFKEIGPEATKVISKEQFRDKVLAIDPTWGIAADLKKVGTHLSWYRSSYKKLPAEAPVAVAAVAVQAQA
jgi:hypothetical protein